MLEAPNLLAGAHFDGTNLNDLVGSLVKACCFKIEENQFLFVFQVFPFYLK